MIKLEPMSPRVSLVLCEVITHIERWKLTGTYRSARALIGRKRLRCTRVRHMHHRKTMFDYLIVGAGFAGSVLAERLANGSNKRVLICDKRPHVAGNAYDRGEDRVHGQPGR